MDQVFSPWFYGPCRKHTGHKSTGKNKDPKLTLRTEKMRLVKYLLYLYNVPDGFGNHFHSRGTATNFLRTSKAKKMLLIHYHTNTQFRAKKKVLNFYLLLKLRTLGNKSLNSLAMKPTLNFSEPYRRIWPAKLTNHSAHTI